MREISVQGEQRIVRIAYSGCVTDSDLATGLMDDSQAGKEFSWVVDLSGVEVFRVSGETIERVAREEKPADHRRCAIIAPTPVAFGLSRMYQAYSRNPEVQVFREATAALEWLANRKE